VARHQWAEVGRIARTKPTKHRPMAADKVSEGAVRLHGQPYRAVVVHSSSQDPRRQKRFVRDMAGSSSTLMDAVAQATPQESYCQADAEAAATKLQALQSAYHQVAVVVEERPKYGPGRPSARQPRAVKSLRYRLKATVRERPEVIAHHDEEAGCFVWLTNVPSAGEMAHSAADGLRAYKEQHGREQNFAFLKDPLMVNSLFLKRPERIEALGLVLWLALLRWRLRERALRVHVETTGGTLTGWDKKETQKPTAFMMITKFAAVMVVKVETQRQLVQPLSAVQQAYLLALGVSPTSFVVPHSG
jgi:transposase